MHKTVNTVVKGLVQEYPEEWKEMLPFAECILRCSPMADLGNRSPYEVVTGLKPKMPAAMVAERDREFIPVTDYVIGLQQYMRDTYRTVQRLQLAAQERAEGTLSGHLSHELEVGDAVLVKRPPAAAAYGGPIRFRPKTYPGVYKISVKISPTTYKVADLADPTARVTFGQPIHADRLIKLDLPELELMPDQPRRIEVQDKDGSTWNALTISRFAADGRVFLVAPGSAGGKWYDLSKEKYRYLL